MDSFGRSKRGRSGSLQTAGEVLGALLAHLGLSGALARHSVVTDWPLLVEPAIARHAKAQKIVDSTLYVIVDSSVWMHELAVLKPVLLGKINSKLPAGTPPVLDIRFHQRSWAGESNDAPRDALPAEADEDSLRLARKILEPLQDDELKTLMARILEKDRCLRWRRSRRHSDR
jgi:hypothetical protein